MVASTNLIYLITAGEHWTNTNLALLNFFPIYYYCCLASITLLISRKSLIVFPELLHLFLVQRERLCIYIR